MSKIENAAPDRPRTAPDRLPACVLHGRTAIFLAPGGSPEQLVAKEAAKRLLATPHLVCNAPFIARRLGLEQLQAYDLLELFAFVRPARFTLPTPRGLAESLTLSQDGGDPDRDPSLLPRAARRLLAEVASETWRARRGAAETAAQMARAGWLWGLLICDAMGEKAARSGGIASWMSVPEWDDGPPPPRPGAAGISEDAAEERLLALLGSDAEPRPQQRAFARAGAHAFDPPQGPERPNIVLAEAGTGTGKTLGYIAPASLWTEINKGPVWLSTYTKALQRQIDQELARLWPDPAERSARAVLRKGRENYACLLNIEEAVRISFGGAATGRDAVMMGLVLRWLAHSRDGDIVGGDFPGWLAGSFGMARLGALTDHRGECLHSACTHYRRCFIERAVRKSRRASLVIANHALVMTMAARRPDDPDLPRRLVLDEGHHLFDAADSAFSARLDGLEGSELRRWIRGRETATRGRARGLLVRIEDLVREDSGAWPLLQDLIDRARVLPGPGWRERIETGGPRGLYEDFLSEARRLVLARDDGRSDLHGLECGTEDLPSPLLESAAALAGALAHLIHPLAALGGRLAAMLEERAEDLDTASRGRLEATARSLALRADMVRTWRDMLLALKDGRNEDFLDWFEMGRLDGRMTDMALCRHWIDPTRPFAELVLAPAHGALIASATLKDRRRAEDEDWRRAETRTGAAHLVLPALRFAVASPFDYARNSGVLIVTDVAKGDIGQIAGAMRALFMASQGGALGLFTAISRLRAVHRRLAPALEAADMTLYAQHVDGYDTGTLVDIFRAEEDACLLGTDAVRDGIDVPGRALRLIAFDRVPWPRPTLLHKARREAFGGSAYDDSIARLRLSQAFGRLLRKNGDRGLFVLLDAATPSRLLDAFPPETPIRRLGIRDAVLAVRDFFA